VTATVDGQRARVYRADFLRGICRSGTHDSSISRAPFVMMTLLWLLPFAALPSLLAADWATVCRSNRRKPSGNSAAIYFDDVQGTY